MTEQRTIETEMLFESVATGDNEPTGSRWLVTIIGARTPEQLVTVGGKEYIRSENGRFYDVSKLEESVAAWHNVKVYDDHLTQEEYDARSGMRSPKNEWLGTIVNPRFERVDGLPRLRGEFVVVESALAEKLKNAWTQNVLESIGLSIDTFPFVGESVHFEGADYPVIEGFRKIISVDLVGNPAAGGGFDRILASTQITEKKIMDEKEVKDLVGGLLTDFKTEITDTFKTTLTEALAENDVDEVGADEVEETDETESAIEDAVKEARLARCELQLERKLSKAKLPESLERVARDSFAGKIFESANLDQMVSNLKEAQVKTDTSGRVKESGGSRGDDMQVTFDEQDKLQVAFMQKAMGITDFRKLEGLKGDELVSERLSEATAYEGWVNAGKPSLGSQPRMSEIMRQMLGGKNPIFDGIRASEASTLATVIKNTVNIMTAADYSMAQRWYETVADVEEVETIDDATLARLFGTATLSTVDKGDAYTELALHDEEETSTFVKKGNYVSVPFEDLMLDKLGFFRTLPSRLSDTWYNTLSALVANVFTLNSGVGPTMSDTGALFNATAATSAGGHANLLTAALSYASYDSVITAMTNQTNMPLGAGRKLTDMGEFNLLVPNNLRSTANQIRNSEYVPSTTTNASAVNPYGPNGEQPNVVKVPDWSDATDWGVLARYRGRSPIKLIFPRGMRTPSIVVADNEAGGSMFTNDSIRWKVRMMTYRFNGSSDCAPVADWRLLHKSNVA